MRSISRMPSDDVAGGGSRRVPVPRKRKAKCAAFLRIPSDVLAGGGAQRMPIQKRSERFGADFGQGAQPYPEGQ